MAEGSKYLSTVVQGNGLFTRNLYQILAEEKNKNVFFSPISIHAILSLAAQGSGGNTTKALLKTLHAPDLKTLAEGYNLVMSTLNTAKDITLHIANKVYLKESYALKDSFKTVVVNKFLSDVQNVNFEQNVEAAKTINAWVEDKTKNKIKDLIQPDDLDADTRLVLVNAIYFKGKWQEPFKPSETTTEKFYLNDKDTVDVQMMHIKKKYFYKEDEALDAKILEMPYTNEDLSMVFILPNKRNGIAELESKLVNVDLTKITENMYKPEVIVALPKFKIETTINLNEPLTKLGLGEMFSDNANFTEMLNSPEQLKVSKVIQKAFIEVNEEGAEAAAATGMVMMMRMAMIERTPERFIVDHPFVINLVKREGERNVVLFSGKIYNPN